MEKFSLKNKVALVTGASRGLGKAISIELAKAGADIILSARDKNTLEIVREEISKLGRQVVVLEADLFN